MSSILSAVELTYVNDKLVSMLVDVTIKNVAKNALSNLHQFAMSDDEIETLKQELNAGEYERFWSLIKDKVSQPIHDEFFSDNQTMITEETQDDVPDEQESILQELEELMYSHAVTKAKYMSSSINAVFNRITSNLDDPDLQDLVQLQRLLNIPRLGAIINKMQLMPAFFRLNIESSFLTSSSSSSCYMEESYAGKFFDSHKKTKKRTQGEDFEENEKAKLKK